MDPTQQWIATTTVSESDHFHFLPSNWQYRDYQVDVQEFGTNLATVYGLTNLGSQRRVTLCPSQSSSGGSFINISAELDGNCGHGNQEVWWCLAPGKKLFLSPARLATAYFTFLATIEISKFGQCFGSHRCTLEQ